MDIKADETVNYTGKLFISFSKTVLRNYKLMKKFKCVSQLSLLLSLTPENSILKLLHNYRVKQELEQTKSGDMFMFYLFLFLFWVLEVFPTQRQYPAGTEYFCSSKSNMKTSSNTS